VHFTEALVLATLSGAWIAAAARSASGTNAKPEAWSAALFCAVVVASLIVVLGARETGVRSPWLELRNLGLFITHDYLVGPAPEFAGVGDAALLLEGIALMWIVRRHSRDRGPVVVGSLTLAAIGAAIMALMQALASDAAQSVIAAMLHARASGPMSDVNAAGSFFAMMALVGFGVAIGRRTTPAVRRMSSAVTIALVVGVWLSGSRMALVATIAFGTLLAAYMRVADARQRRWTVGLVAIGAAAVLIALTVGLDPRPSASRTASSSFSRRADFMITGLRMIGSAPAFGVGIGRYFERSGSFMPESIYWFYFHENAHNNFLQIGGELGLVGLAAFLWLLAAIARRILAAIRARPDDVLLIGAAVGTGAFVATWLTSHPLLVPEVAYPFWLLVGVTLAHADTISAASPARAPRFVRAPIGAAAVLLVLASAPVRIAAAQAAQPLDRMTFGFYDWEDDNGFPYRWTSRRATFFVPAGARELRLTLRSMMILGHVDPVAFSVAVNGRVLDSFRITQGNWQTVRLRLPPAADPRGFTRIDVMTDPAWTPAATGANHDVRVLGVQLGRPEAQ
jgi:O-Antigen ligase